MQNATFNMIKDQTLTYTTIDTPLKTETYTYVPYSYSGYSKYIEKTTTPPVMDGQYTYYNVIFVLTNIIDSPEKYQLPKMPRKGINQTDYFYFKYQPENMDSDYDRSFAAMNVYFEEGSSSPTAISRAQKVFIYNNIISTITPIITNLNTAMATIISGGRPIITIRMNDITDILTQISSTIDTLPDDKKDDLILERNNLISQTWLLLLYQDNGGHIVISGGGTSNSNSNIMTGGTLLFDDTNTAGIDRLKQVYTLNETLMNDSKIKTITDKTPSLLEGDYEKTKNCAKFIIDYNKIDTEMATDFSSLVSKYTKLLTEIKTTHRTKTIDILKKEFELLDKEKKVIEEKQKLFLKEYNTIQTYKGTVFKSLTKDLDTFLDNIKIAYDRYILQYNSSISAITTTSTKIETALRSSVPDSTIQTKLVAAKNDLETNTKAAVETVQTELTTYISTTPTPTDYNAISTKLKEFKDKYDLKNIDLVQKDKDFKLIYSSIADAATLYAAEIAAFSTVKGAIELILTNINTKLDTNTDKYRTELSNLIQQEKTKQLGIGGTPGTTGNLVTKLTTAEGFTNATSDINIKKLTEELVQIEKVITELEKNYTILDKIKNNATEKTQVTKNIKEIKDQIQIIRNKIAEKILDGPSQAEYSKAQDAEQAIIRLNTNINTKITNYEKELTKTKPAKIK